MKNVERKQLQHNIEERDEQIKKLILELKVAKMKGEE